MAVTGGRGLGGGGGQQSCPSGKQGEEPHLLSEAPGTARGFPALKNHPREPRVLNYKIEK